MTGIICINKEKDITSFGVCAKVRGITREKKVGHMGTLDPMATGVLPVMLGSATRFLNFIPESDKAYRASFILGKTTDTLDITGNVVSECDANFTGADIEAVLPEFRGAINQLPPMYSAVSVDGKRLYELAREGKTVERKERQVEIKRLELIGEENKEYTIDVKCSKGTYIRSLIDDIGKTLGCGAVMTSLVRTEAMGFSLQECLTLGELQKIKDDGKNFSDVLLSLESVLGVYEAVSVSSAQSKRFSNGGALDANRIRKELERKIYRVYSPENVFLGLGENDGTQLKVLKLLPNQN